MSDETEKREIQCGRCGHLYMQMVINGEWTVGDCDRCAMRNLEGEASDDQPSSRSTAWLVEFPPLSNTFALSELMQVGPDVRETRWLCGEHPTWRRLNQISDPDKALRFARKRDAQAFIDSHLDPAWKAFPSEHSWVE